MQRDDVVFRDLDNVEPTIKLYNDMLENKLNNKIVQERYYMHIPLPVRYVKSKKEKGTLVCVDYDVVYDMFYFGNKASSITSAQELSTFRGTFLNLESLSGVNLMTSTGKSSMASYNVLSQQVEANR
ncbi:hypothetical protein KBA84_00880 [Patescibacteria group bacterium]|jgi:hypothetical protein|nr:hypothetical protein [Patescibacteria group bacterium]